jgi:hypothetical protein
MPFEFSRSVLADKSSRRVQRGALYSRWPGLHVMGALCRNLSCQEERPMQEPLPHISHCDLDLIITCH